MQVFNYRGKSLKTGEWIYGQLLYNSDYDVAIIVEKMGRPLATINLVAHSDRVDKSTVCAQVGTAKNGDPVYEGDVVESCSWNEFFCKDGVTLEPFIRKFVVMFKDCRAVLKEIFDYGNWIAETSALFNLDDVSDLVVKGNLIDDPKLSPMTFNEYCEKIKLEKPEVNYVKQQTNPVQSSIHPL